MNKDRIINFNLRVPIPTLGGLHPLCIPSKEYRGQPGLLCSEVGSRSMVRNAYIDFREEFIQLGHKLKPFGDLLCSAREIGVTDPFRKMMQIQLIPYMDHSIGFIL